MKILILLLTAFIVGIGCFFVALFFKKVLNRWDSRRYLRLLVLIGVLLTILIPKELAASLFLSFRSPEQLCVEWYNTEPLVYAEGQESALLIYSSKKSSVYRGVLRTENGWKLKNGLTIRQSFVATNLQHSIELIRVSGTNDYYVIVCASPTYKGKISVCDTNGSKFIQYFEADGALSYISYIPELAAEYTVSVNGEIFDITNAYQKLK